MRTGIYQFDPEDARRFANERGIKATAKGDELQFRYCPYCGQYTDDKNTFAINLRTGQFKCLRASCNAHGNMITLARDFAFSLGTAADEYYQPKKRYRSFPTLEKREPKSAAVAYLESRGISAGITERYNLTTAKDSDDVLVFPFCDETGKLQFIKYRNMNYKKGDKGGKEWCESNCKPILFGMSQCNPENKTLILTEGQIDSLSVAECGIENAVSVPTGANGYTWVPYCWDFLGRFDMLVVFGDHEHDHITLLEEMRVRFTHGTVKHVRPEDYLDCKDANELLQKHGKDAVVAAVNNAIPVENKQIKRLVDAKRLDLSEMERLDTGIRELDRMTNGLYFGSVILVTGKRGNGKSTLVSQFGTMAVKQGYNLMIYSGEMPEEFLQEWFERQAAGPDSINVQETRYGYKNYLINAEAAKAIAGWYGDKVYYRDNSAIDGEENEGILEILEIAIRQYSCRVLIVDNLMTAMEDDLRGDLYRQQTAFIKSLSVMSKKYNVLIFLVAHPRKENGSEYDSDDVLGSSNITNLAEVVLRYDEPKKDDTGAPRVLSVLKNRYGGMINRSGIPMYYDERSKRISSDGKFDWQCGWESCDFVDVDVPEEIPF